MIMANVNLIIRPDWRSILWQIKFFPKDRIEWLVFFILYFKFRIRTCPSPGIHWDFRSCDSYFVCVLAGRQWKVFHMQCPNGLGFNHLKKVCTVEKALLKEVKL